MSNTAPKLTKLGKLQIFLKLKFTFPCTNTELLNSIINNICTYSVNNSGDHT